jgi:FAD/FMN-containing dehydrogenase
MSAPRRIIPTLVGTCLRVGLLETPSEILADPGFGSVRLLFWGDSDSQGIKDAIGEIRRAARQHGASVVIEICHPSIKATLDVWGEEPGSMKIMRRIKDQLDPQHLLNRGRFLGRI